MSADSKFCNDRVLQGVNKFVSLNKNRKARNIAHLNTIMEILLPKLKENDKTFNDMYNSIMYGGSYYKGTKVEEPDEFDLDLVIEVQQMSLKLEMVKDQPGYVKIKSTNYQENLSAFDNIVNEEGYLDQNKFRSWLESVFDKMISSLKPNPLATYQISKKGSGPAQTLTVKIISTQETIDVDIVGCLKFSFDKPLQGFNCPKGNCYAIPKPMPNDKDGNLLWRLCFYDQEKDLLSSKGHLKTVLRLLKKLRNTENFPNICSYYIETLFLHEIKSKKKSFWNKNTLTYLFMHMLKKLQLALEKHEIPFYWCKKMNLLKQVSEETTKNIALRLLKIINKIESTIKSDPLVIARFILSKDEF